MLIYMICISQIQYILYFILLIFLEFCSKLDSLVVAEGCYQSREYHRALMYLEQHMASSNKGLSELTEGGLLAVCNVPCLNMIYMTHFLFYNVELSFVIYCRKFMRNLMNLTEYLVFWRLKISLLPYNNWF